MIPTRRRTAQTTAALVAAAAGAIGVGCNTLETSTDARLAPEPTVVPRFASTQPASLVDASASGAATQTSTTQPALIGGQPVRNWPKSVANYQNGDTASGSTGVRYISDVGQLFGRGGRTTRSDVVAVGGGVGASGVTPMGGATAGTTAGATGTGGDTVVGTLQPGTGGTGAATPAVASGTTINGQVVRGDGSLAPVGSPGAAGTSGSIAATSGGVGQSVAAQDVGAFGGDTVAAGQTADAAASAGTPGAPLSRTETIAAGAALPFVETGVFVANIVTSPVTFYQQRDGILSTGYEFPETHTAMPYLPPEPGRTPPTPAAVPVGVAAPKAGLAPLPSVVPATNPAAARAAQNPATILPPVVPVKPLRPAATMPATPPAPATMSTATPAPRPTPTAASTRPADVAAPRGVSSPATQPTRTIAAAARKPGTLKRAPDVSSNAFVVAGSAPYAGRYEVEPNLTLDDALRGAGVLPAEDSGVMVRLQRRGSTESTPVALAALRARTGAGALVQPGDILTVVKSR